LLEKEIDEDENRRDDFFDKVTSNSCLLVRQVRASKLRVQAQTSRVVRARRFAVSSR
jgi:hypothetical protein